MGLLRVSPPSTLFSGFANPALFTVAVVLVLSIGIVESGILDGLGKNIARKVQQPEKQILTISLAAGFISAFINNAGVVGLILPTAQRMALRAGIKRANFGLPLTYAAILGGSITLIGTASNIIVSTFRMQAFGQPFKMFDFTAHGLAMFGTALLLWFICQLCGYQPINKENNSNSKILLPEDNVYIAANLPSPLAKHNIRNKLIAMLLLIPAVLLTSIGFIHPAIAFGFVVLFLTATNILSYEKAYKALSIPLILFLGSILSIANILQETGALSIVINQIVPLVKDLPPLFLILIFVYATAFFANILNNSTAAVLMAPAATILYQSGSVSVSADALLMAVAAGSSLGIVLPTHHATIVTISSMNFSSKNFMRTGGLIFLFAGSMAAFVIHMVWL